MFDDKIGKHCQFNDCNKKDYLNFYCNSCDKYLCKEHYHHDLSCPIKMNSKNIENSLNKINPSWNSESSIKILKCDYCNQKIPQFSSIKCKFCYFDFCMKHRLEMDHKCKRKYIDHNHNINENDSIFSSIIKKFTNLNLLKISNKQIKTKS